MRNLRRYWKKESTFRINIVEFIEFDLNYNFFKRNENFLIFWLPFLKQFFLMNEFSKMVQKAKIFVIIVKRLLRHMRWLDFFLFQSIQFSHIRDLFQTDIYRMFLLISHHSYAKETLIYGHNIEGQKIRSIRSSRLRFSSVFSFNTHKKYMRIENHKFPMTESQIIVFLKENDFEWLNQNRPKIYNWSRNSVNNTWRNIPVKEITGYWSRNRILWFKCKWIWDWVNWKYFCKTTL